MSTSVYVLCLDHSPVLESVDEVTQHLDDDYYRNAVRLIRARPLADEETWDGWYRGMDSGSTSYFESHARRFLYQHPTCRLCLVSEYGERFDTGNGIIGVNET